MLLKLLHKFYNMTLHSDTIAVVIITHEIIIQVRGSTGMSKYM